jgi:hypothetical protein
MVIILAYIVGANLLHSDLTSIVHILFRHHIDPRDTIAKQCF